MKTQFLKTALFLLYSLSLTISIHAQSELLKKESISSIMQQIFEQHVDKKQITPDLLKHAFNMYIEDFDPNQIYLLNSEVQPYLAPTSSELYQDLEQYHHNNYSAFIQLNELIKKAILRARLYREELKTERKISLPDAPLSKFAANEQELKNRIQQDMLHFFLDQAENSVTADAWQLYDKKMQQQENPYLGFNENGQPLSPELQEHYFVLHILKALSSGLDSHTKFLDNREAVDLKIRLEKSYHGIGVRLAEKDHQLYITSLIEGGPAAKSNKIQVNDRIVEINGISTKDKSITEALNMLHQDEPSTTTLVLLRGKEKVTVPLKREKINLDEGRVESYAVSFDNGLIGVLKIHSFYRNDDGISTLKDVMDGIEKLQQRGNLKGLILDLRDNMGGFLTQAVQVASQFITSGVIVVSKYSNGETQYYRDLNGVSFFNGPLVILTSRETASAAEIVTQALQDYGVALVVGDDHTYGKGTIQSQTVTEAGNPTFFKVTVGKYYTVSGKTPQKNGVLADIVVPSELQGYLIGEQYLEYTESADEIAPSYNDSLSDIPPRLMNWYLHFYEPKLQKKENQWDKFLPLLKKNSKERLAKNYDYNALLEGRTPKDPKNWLFPTDFEDATPEGDLQLQEAISIVKEMILLNEKKRFINEF